MFDRSAVRHLSLSRRTMLKGSSSVVLGGAALFDRSAASGQTGRSRINIINSASTISMLQLTVLRELSLFGRYGVEPHIVNVSDSNKALAGVLSGQEDICSGAGFSGIFPAIERGAEIKILAGTIIAPTNVIYSAKPAIKSVADLVGHTVGTGAPGSLLHQLAVAVMKKYGVDYRKVQFVNIGSSNDVFKALVAGTIDAGVAPIEFEDSAPSHDLRLIRGGEIYKELPLYTNQAMFASNDAITRHRQGLIGVIAAYTEMNRWMADPGNKEAFLAFYQKALPHSSPGNGAFLQSFFCQPHRLATDPSLSAEQVDYVQGLNVELGIQKAVLPFGSCADMSLARAALQILKS